MGDNVAQRRENGLNLMLTLKSQMTLSNKKET